MAATRRQHKNQKESAWVPPLQRDPGPWNRLLLNWLATLAIIMVFGLVMLYSASYTTGYLRMGDSLHYIKQQAICMAIGIGCMVVMSYVDHRFLRWASKPLYWVVLAMLAVTLTFAPLNGWRRWIRLGGLTLQTSEVAKFEMILLSSHLAASAPQIGRFSPSLREKIKPKDWLFIRIVRQLIVPVLPLVPVVVLLFLEPFARLLGADEITLDYVKHYLLGLAPFSVCYLVSYNLEVLVKTDGFPRYALFTVIAGCLTNCVLDYIAIFWLDMGVFGAAVATGISQLVTCISYFAHFFSKKCTFRLRKFRFDPRLYARILPIGLSDGVTELCTGLMIFLFNRTVLKCIGTDGVVTYTVIAYATTIIINLMVGVSQGTQPLVSYQYGKEDYTSCRKLLRYALTTVCVLAPVLFVLIFLFAPQIVRAYLSHATDELIAYSIQAFRKYSISYLLLGFNIVIGGFMTANERPVPAICISVGRGLVLQSAVLFALAVSFGGDAVWFTPIFSEFLCLVFSLRALKAYRRHPAGNRK